MTIKIPIVCALFALAVVSCGADGDKVSIDVTASPNISTNDGVLVDPEDLTSVTNSDDSDYMAELKLGAAANIEAEGPRVDSSGLDLVCVSSAVLDEIGQEALQGAGVDPDSVSDLPAELSPSEEQLREIAFSRCLIEDIAVDNLINRVGGAYGEDVVKCVIAEAGSVSDLLSSAESDPAGFQEQFQSGPCVELTTG